MQCKYPDKSLIFRLHKQGKTSVEISKEVNVTPESVRYHLHKAGFLLQTRREAATKYPVLHTYFDNINCQDKAFCTKFLRD